MEGNAASAMTVIYEGLDLGFTSEIQRVPSMLAKLRGTKVIRDRQSELAPLFSDNDIHLVSIFANTSSFTHS